MSLDVYLYAKIPLTKKGTGIFIRENGGTRELTMAEVSKKFPGAIAKETETETDYLFSANITHNLTDMAGEAGLYYALWRPEEIGAKKARDIIRLLTDGLEELKAKPEYYRKFDAPNGWGTYDQFVPWVQDYLDACHRHPDAIIRVSR